MYGTILLGMRQACANACMQECMTETNLLGVRSLVATSTRFSTRLCARWFVLGLAPGLFGGSMLDFEAPGHLLLT